MFIRAIATEWILIFGAVCSVGAQENDTSNDTILREQVAELKEMAKSLLERIETLESRLQNSHSTGKNVPLRSLPMDGYAPLGLEGFCPVTLCDKHRWVRGDVRYSVIHGGRKYHCAGVEQQQAFLADRQRYAPLFSGYDPVLAVDEKRLVDGRREHGVYYGEQIILFAAKASRDRFEFQPFQYVGEAAETAVMALQRESDSIRPPLLRDIEEPDPPANSPAIPQAKTKELKPAASTRVMRQRGRCRRLRIGRRGW